MQIEDVDQIKALIEHFLQGRLAVKAEMLAPDDPKREELVAQYELGTWVADAARRVGQLQVVTHSLKPLHPDAKGSNLYAPPESLVPHSLVGSHLLPEDFDGDVVGNAAALDVYKFLKLEHNGRSLLDRVLEGDPALTAALSKDPEQAREWMTSFAAITEPRGGEASHTHAKQVYWLVGDDPGDNGSFHLLAPLYATSLAHRVYQTINEDRFGETTKAARQARRDGRYWEGGYRDYPNIAVQKFGGTKPQNISQLNSERGGSNYLLASLPPTWVDSGIKPPFFTDSVFPRFGRRKEVRRLLSGLRRLLMSDAEPNAETRDRRDEYVGALIDELVAFASRYSVLESGWSASPDCRLVEAEALWLDPWRDDESFARHREQGDWAEEVRRRFATWLNSQFGKSLPLGDAEFAFWQKQLAKRLNALQEDLPYV
jgi:CRISPR-associated protein Csy1